MRIDLKPWEINVILKALAEQHYNRVASIVEHIKDQVDSEGQTE